MNSDIIDERLRETLRQERETFDQHKSHQNKWFILRVWMGYIALVLLPSIFVCCLYFVFKHKDYPSAVVVAASSAIFVDVIGLVICVWKIVLNPKFMTRLSPIAKWHPLDQTPDLNKKEILNVVSALYGANGVTNDVTNILRNKISSGKLEIGVNNNELNGDPIKNVRKELTVIYTWQGETKTIGLNEGRILNLP